MKIELIIGLTAGILTSLASLPQLIKIIRKKEARDLSIGMLVILLTGVSLWVVYGLMKKDLPLIITNGISFALNICLLVLRIIYGKK